MFYDIKCLQYKQILYNFWNFESVSDKKKREKENLWLNTKKLRKEYCPYLIFSDVSIF